MEAQNFKQIHSLLADQSEILHLISQGQAIEYISTHIVNWVEKYSSNYYYASILFLDDDSKRLLHGAAPSLPLEYNTAINGIEIGPNVGSCGTAAFTKKPVFAEDIENDPLWKNFRHLALRFNLRSCWSVPLINKTGKVMGTFAIYSNQVCKPTDEDIALVNLVSRTAVLALEFHALEKELNKYGKRLSLKGN